jgi:hypothetical protein
MGKKQKAKESLFRVLKISMGICYNLSLINIPHKYEGPTDRDELTRLIRELSSLQNKSIAALDQFKAASKDFKNL